MQLHLPLDRRFEMFELIKFFILILVIVSEVRRCKSELPPKIGQPDDVKYYLKNNWLPIVICLSPTFHYMIEACHVITAAATV